MALGDMFLKVEGSRQGPIKGEAQDEKHPAEIDVLGWSWGMRAQTAMGGAGASGKSTLLELQVSKKVDSATTGLMSAMRNNEPLKRVVLTVRKAGKEPLEYFKITLQQARITSVDVGAVGGGGDSLNESVSFAFKTIGVDYVPQGTEGGQRGSMSFETEVDRA